MAADRLGAADVAAVLTTTAQSLRESAHELDALDGAIGDGDHGSSVATLFETAVADVDLDAPTPGALVSAFGQSLMRHCSGASGTLYSVLFLNVGAGLGTSEAVGLDDLARAFRRGLDAVQKVGGAAAGDATFVDALAPFVSALEGEARSGAGLSDALAAAAEAAREGADATASMLARVGRAKNFGERTLGVEDPGARSFAVMARAWTVER